MIFRVFRQVAMRARLFDRVDDRRTFGFQALEIRTERL
jgi:hypothetical protein